MHRLLLVLPLALVTLSTLRPESMSAQPSPSTPKVPAALKIGLVSTLFRDMPAPVINLAMRPFRVLLETQTGLTGSPVVTTSPLLLGREIKEDKIQLGVFHGIEFAWARQHNPELEPIILAINQQRTLFAQLVVHKNSPVQQPVDLKGKDIALPLGSREHCRIFLQRRCVQNGSTPATFFRQVMIQGDIEDALEDVIDGKIQGVIVDEVSLAAFARNKPGRARQLRCLLRSEAFPPAVIACQKGRFTDAELVRLRTGLVNARHDRVGKQLLEMLKISAFEVVGPDYFGLCDSIARAYPAE